MPNRAAETPDDSVAETPDDNSAEMLASKKDEVARSTDNPASAMVIGRSIRVRGAGVVPHTAAEVNATRVLTAPVPGSVSGATEATVTSDQLSSAPAQPRVTRSNWSPALAPVTFPASSTEAGPASVTDPLERTGSVGSGSRVASTSEGPGKLAAAATSKVCAGTPGVAVLDSGMPAGITSGSAGRVVVRIAPTCPVAASP